MLGPLALLVRVVLPFCACFSDGHFVLPNRNPEHDAFLTNCADSIDPSLRTLLCGDFITVLDHAIDCCGSCPLDTCRESSSLLSSIFMTVVWSISGDSFIPVCLLSLGLGGIIPLPLVLTL